MLDASSDVNPPQPVRLADYRPPAFLIDTVDLVFDLNGSNARVKSRLGMRRNPAAFDPTAPLPLDGQPLGDNRYQLPAGGGLILTDVPDAFTLDVETRIAP